jgi:hypothetical protein
MPNKSPTWWSHHLDEHNDLQSRTSIIQQQSSTHYTKLHYILQQCYYLTLTPPSSKRLSYLQNFCKFSIDLGEWYLWGMVPLGNDTFWEGITPLGQGVHWGPSRM